MTIPICPTGRHTSFPSHSSAGNECLYSPSENFCSASEHTHTHTDQTSRARGPWCFAIANFANMSPEPTGGINFISTNSMVRPKGNDGQRSESVRTHAVWWKDVPPGAVAQVWSHTKNDTKRFYPYESVRNFPHISTRNDIACNLVRI